MSEKIELTEKQARIFICGTCEGTCVGSPKECFVFKAAFKKAKEKGFIKQNPVEKAEGALISLGKSKHVGQTPLILIQNGFIYYEKKIKELKKQLEEVNE